jgi:hypothetical protein
MPDEPSHDAKHIGAALDFLLIGSDLTITGSAEGMRRLADAIHAAADEPGDREVLLKYTTAGSGEPADIVLRLFSVSRTLKSAGSTNVYPATSFFGCLMIFWFLVLPFVGFAALVWLIATRWG